MQGSRMSKTIRMEQFQIAFVHALAAVNGWRTLSITPDYDGVDLSISGSCPAKNGFSPIFEDPIIHVQLKATTELRILKNGSLSYDLEVKNYNQLIGNKYSTERYLFVLDIPESYEEWCQLTSSSIVLRNKCYWISLKNNPPTNNKSTITINIPGYQILTPKVLSEIMYAAAEGKVYVHR
jgi:hypothetical protein